MTTIACPHCGTAYDASHRIAGDTVWCSGCDGMFVVRFAPQVETDPSFVCDGCGRETHIWLNGLCLACVDRGE